MAFLEREKLEQMGFAKLGENVLISDKASIYNPAKMSIGSHVRIDDFCTLSAGEGGFDIGNHVHVACYVSIIGSAKITLADYVGISSHTAVYSSSDDYSGNFMTNPTIDPKFKNVDIRPVTLEKLSLIGAGCIILPGVTVGEGTAVGALSLVTKDLDPWGVYIGSPIKYIKPRSREMLKFIPEIEGR